MYMDNNNNPALCPPIMNVMEGYVIKAYFAVRDAYASAGRNDDFRKMCDALDPAKAYNHVMLVDGSSSTSSPNQMQLTWNGPPPYMPCDVPDYQLEVEAINDDYHNVNDGQSTGNNFTDIENDEPLVIDEIPNSESSLAKGCKRKVVEQQIQATPKKDRIPITHNLFGILPFGNPKALFQNVDDVQSSGNWKSPRTPDKHTRKQGPNGCLSAKRLSPYNVPPPPKSLGSLTIPHEQNKFLEKGLLKKGVDGKFAFDIEKILEHFGSDRDQLLKTIKAKKARNAPQLLPEEYSFMATCVVQCLRTTYGCKRVKDGLEQACVNLNEYFSTYSKDRWDLFCNTALAKMKLNS